MGETSSKSGVASGKASRPIVVKLFGRTDVGQIREHNEDNFLIANLSTGARGLMEENRNPTVDEGGIVLGVCDGMGGAAAGEVASKMAVDIIYEQLRIGGPAGERDEIARRLVHAIEYAGAQIFQEARSDRSRRGMGTTSTIAVFVDNRVFVGQVGDSRAYLLRDGKLVQLSRDQSLVNQLIEAGQLTEEEAETFEHNNIILQALGTAETVQVDLTYVDLCQGDVLMMCSDGLSGMIRSDEIREVLMRCDEPLEACRELTDRANAAGGHDNITVIVAHFDEGLDAPTPESTFGYQKYALPDVTPEAPDFATTASRLSPGDTLGSGVLAEETLREERNLRVGHTMVGVLSPFSTPPEGAPVAEQVRSLPSARDEATFRSGGSEAPNSRNRRLSDEPVALPTTGVPATVMIVIIGFAMLLAGALGYLVMK
jgi:PPM family protein phosphatase